MEMETEMGMSIETDKYGYYADILKRLECENRLRHIPSAVNARNMLDLCSNDYMGLNARREEFIPNFIEKYGFPSPSSSASRLLSVHQQEYTRLESLLEYLYQRPALLFNSGYHANVGVISALADSDTLFVVDRLIHASVIDGLIAGRAEFKRFRHNDIGHLRKIIQAERHRFKRIIIVVETVYSMDGDLAPLAELVTLRDEFKEVLLYVDEAHGFGVFGERGLGVCERDNVMEKPDFIVGTLGKAAASEGAFVICAPVLKSYLLNTARSFIFSTALSPFTVSWSHFMIEQLLTMGKEREYLKRLSQYFIDSLNRLQFPDIPEFRVSSLSPIVPFITGSAESALGLSEYLRNRGINALAIRRPTVPPGTERVRFSLNANLSFDDIDKTVEAIKCYFESIVTDNK